MNRYNYLMNPFLQVWLAVAAGLRTQFGVLHVGRWLSEGNVLPSYNSRCLRPWQRGREKPWTY